MVRAVKSVVAAARMVHHLLNVTYEDYQQCVRDEALMTATEIFTQVEREVKLTKLMISSVDFTGAFNQTIYSNYTAYVEGMDEADRRQWLYALSEACTAVRPLERILEDRMTAEVHRITENLWQSELTWFVSFSVRRVVGHFDPPDLIGPFAAVRQQLRVWRSADVVNDPDVPDAEVVLRAIELRRHLALALKNFFLYVEEEHRRVRGSIFETCRAAADGRVYFRKTQAIEQGNAVKQIKRCLALFTLEQMAQRVDSESERLILRRVRYVVEKARDHLVNTHTLCYGHLQTFALDFDEDEEERERATRAEQQEDNVLDLEAALAELADPPREDNFREAEAVDRSATESPFPAPSSPIVQEPESSEDLEPDEQAVAELLPEELIRPESASAEAASGEVATLLEEARVDEEDDLGADSQELLGDDHGHWPSTDWQPDSLEQLLETSCGSREVDTRADSDSDATDIEGPSTAASATPKATRGRKRGSRGRGAGGKRARR